MSKKKNKSKVKKKIPFLYKLFSIILILVMLTLIGSIMIINILNIPLLIIILLVIFLISIFSIFLMLKSKRKKTGFTLSVILILIFSLLIFYINKTTGLLNSLNLNYKTYNYSVIVLEKSDYHKLVDINGLNIGFYDDNSNEMEKALNKVLKKVELETTSYEDTHALADALLKEDVDAVLIEKSYIDILNESITYEDKTFKENIREIYNFTIVINTSDIAKDINVLKKPFNIYVSGIDTYGEISSISRSDVNMIISVNPSTRQILLTSIPRDYYVKLHGKSGYKDKLTHAGLYGIDMSIQTLEDLLDIEINYYVKVNFSSIIDIVNAIGGVTVYSDYTFTSLDNYNYQKGYNEVNGEEALSFARERKSFITGDRQRVKNQQAVFKAIFDKCTSKAIITKYSKLLDSLNGSFVTNMPTSRLTSLIRLQISKNYSWNIVTNSLEGSDASDYTYSAPSQKVYVMVPKEESVLYAKELINQVIEGKILDEEVIDEVSKKVNKVTQNKNTSNESSNEENSISTNEEEETFNAELIKDSITIMEGEEYTYHGFKATYNDKDITNDSGLEVSFTVNNKTTTDYMELIYYITNNLTSGNYTITYTLKYKEDTISLYQKLIITEDLNKKESLEYPSEGEEDEILDLEVDE